MHIVTNLFHVGKQSLEKITDKVQVHHKLDLILLHVLFTYSHISPLSVKDKRSRLQKLEISF